jgi:flagellar biosynthesis/type III secretory pathway chaperone
MIIQQEIKSILKTEGHAIVEERIVPKLLVNITKRTSDLMKKVTTLDKEDSQQSNRAYRRIYTDLVGQTIRELIKYQYERKK